jgi:PAS domain S-box-containing protein
MNPSLQDEIDQSIDMEGREPYAPQRLPPTPPAAAGSLHELVTLLESTRDSREDCKGLLEKYIQNYRTIVENIPDLVYSLDERGIIVLVNKAVNAFGYSVDELVGTFFANLIYQEDRDYTTRGFFDIAAQSQNRAHSQKFRIVTKSGDLRWLEANCSIHFTLSGDFIWQEGVCRDITETVQAQHALMKTQNSLEEEVRKRTTELTRASLELQKEILERRETERALRERERDLEQEKANLQEANTALKVLLKRRKLDKRAFEEQVLHNVQKLVLPYLKLLSAEVADERQMTYLQIIETNLNDITAGFARRLSVEYSGLTKTEIKVADFIRHGMKNRHIAEQLGLSVRTVEAYRMSIRDKLKIHHKKVNLCTYLKSMR